MSLVELFGGVKKSLYKESEDKCRRLEEDVAQLKSKISELETENFQLRGTSSEALDTPLRQRGGYTRGEARPGHNDGLARR